MPSGALAGLAGFWADLPLRAKAAILIGLPIVVLGAGGLIVLSATTLQESEAQLWVDHTLLVRAKLGTILNKLLATEAAARAYVIAHRAGSLPNIAQAKAQVGAQIDSLEQLVADNPEQHDRVAFLRALAAEKFAALEAQLDTPRNETSESKRELDRNEKALAPLQETLQDLDVEEARLQEIRTATMQQSRRIVVSAATETLILGFLAGLGAALIFAGSIARRMEDLQQRARAMRTDMALVDEAPSEDEIGRVKQELTLTSERLAERSRELRDRESELRAIIDHTTAIVCVKNLESRFLITNRAMEEAHAISPGGALGKVPREIFPAKIAEQIRANDLEVLRSGKSAEFEEQIPRGETLRTFLSIKVPLMDERGAPYALCDIATDITDRQRAAAELREAHNQLEERVTVRTAELREANEQLRAESAQHRATAETLQQTQTQLLHAQKMEVAGTVACGIAHDFNNVLTAIMGYASLLLGEMAEPDRKQAHAAKIMRTAERAAALSRQLLAFGRLQPNEPRLIDVAEIIRESESMFSRILGDTITLRTEVTRGANTVRVDPGQIEQLLLNLALNARDAMPRGGTVTIAVARRDGITRQPTPEVAPGDGWLEISVTDEGIGMEPEVRAKVFEPFYSTKRAGRGSGLGLASSVMIAEQNHGWLECESEFGEGTIFRLFLPRVDLPAAPAPAKSAPSDTGGNETLLVVEDEPVVGEIVALLLRTLGYTVLTAENGEAAERVIAESSGRIDLVLTDLNMPRMNGRELIARLMKSNPGVRVILTSGGDELLAGGDTRPFVEFLPKPFTRQGLAAKVRVALDK